jgi:hypothetical protein
MVDSRTICEVVEYLRISVLEQGLAARSREVFIDEHITRRGSLGR